MKINIDKIKTGTVLKQLKPILMNGKEIGCIGKEYSAIRCVADRMKKRIVLFDIDSKPETVQYIYLNEGSCDLSEWLDCVEIIKE